MKPYKFQPYLKTTIWGGYQIAPFKGIFNAQPNVGESWEISDKYKELLVGKKIYKKFGNQFPLLVKFIDSRQDLSVQVHPDDKLAMERHGCAGKTEMWYIIKNDVGSKIYSGLRKSITPEEYEQLATAEPQNGRSPMQDVIATHEAHEGDLYFLPAGRLHAIGAGNFLAEIQQTSDITYRVYDFGRKDVHGNPRELHIEQAKEAIDYQVWPVAQQIDFHCDSFVIVVCLWGKANINGIEIRQGETILVPASENILYIFGNATFLTATM